MLHLLFGLLSLSAGSVLAQNVTSTDGAMSSGSATSDFMPTPVSTSVPSATDTNAPVPGQGNYPPAQLLCAGGENSTFCAGPLLQDVQLSGIFSDSKTFVDKPTNGSLNETLAAYNALPANKTVGDILQFVETYFQGEGLELSQVEIEGFNENPAILDNVTDPLYKAWVSVVNSYWTLLVRETNETAVCQGPDDCASSLIPLNNTIVVPGGRFREYWDSYWILLGLLESELNNYALDLLENFMDMIDVYGFFPNGGRKYYLNRSQPPVFVQMVDLYVKRTGNTTILSRALPIMDTELEWWQTNRTLEVTSPFTNKTYNVAHFNVTNSAPRPEGYLEDYLTVEESSPPLNASAKADLYAELATGAESGWDYTVRWVKYPVQNKTDDAQTLRGLNIRSIIPVDLNSLLAGDHALLADMYSLYHNSSSNNTTQDNSTEDWSSRVDYHREMAQNFSDAVLDLHWDAEKSWFYDFNLTSNDRESLYTMAGTFPLWQNITPPEIVNNEAEALKVASGLRYLLGKYSGIPAISTLVDSGLNWDFPNAWPPHTYTAIKTIETLGRVGGNATVLSNITVGYDDVVPGQLGLDASELVPQPDNTVGNATLYTGMTDDLPWHTALSVEFANRYMQAGFCSWYSTGGAIDGLLLQLPVSELNKTGDFETGQSGVMFEKFNSTEIDAAGGGGEYKVQVGFGWTNGVVLWIAGEYGKYLPQPSCPLIPIVEMGGLNSTAGANSTGATNGTMMGRRADHAGRAIEAAEGKLFQGYRLPKH